MQILGICIFNRLPGGAYIQCPKDVVSQNLAEVKKDMIRYYLVAEDPGTDLTWANDSWFRTRNPQGVGGCGLDLTLRITVGL